MIERGLSEKAHGKRIMKDLNVLDIILVTDNSVWIKLVTNRSRNSTIEPPKRSRKRGMKGSTSVINVTDPPKSNSLRDEQN